MNRKFGLTCSAVALVLLALASPATAARWTPLGPPDGSTVLSLAYDSAHPATVYAGTVGGGVVKSLNGGKTWAYASLGLTESVVTALAVDRQDSQAVYAGTTGGLFRSHNGGRTWQPSSMDLPVDAIAVDPQSAGSVYIGTKNGMYHSFDGGLRWARMGQNLVPGEPRFWVPSLVVAPSHPRTLYAAYFGGRSGVFRSLDAGKNWTRILQGGVTSVAVDPTNAGIVYAAEGKKIWISANSGQTWKQNTMDAPVSDLYMEPGRTLCALTENGAYWSLDQGAHWEAIAGLPNRVIQTMVFNPIDSTKLLVGTTGDGVYRSEDSGATWQVSSKGLVNFAALAVVVLPNPHVLLTGSYSGIYRSINGGISWRRVLRDVPIRSLAVDPSDSATIYAGAGGYRPGSDTSQLLFKSTDSGKTWLPAATGITFGPILSLAVDPVTPRTVYAGAWDVFAANQGFLFRSKDGGATWKAIPGLGGVSSIAFDPTNSKVIYITQGRGLFHSRDGGQTWSQRMVGEVPTLGARMTRSVAVSPVNPDRLAVVDFKSIFLSLDTGKTWVKSNGCSPMCWDVTFDPLYADNVYVGHNPGVLRSLDAGNHWLAFSTGLPGVDVFNITFDPAKPTRLYAGTGSAGLFQVDLGQ